MKNLFFLFLTCITLLHSQDDEVYFIQSSEDYFLLGMRQYAQSDYKSALLSFQNSIAVSPVNHRITAATMMLAKTHYAVKDYLGAKIICDSFVVRFPSSLYQEDALFTRGMCEYNQGGYSKTIQEMGKVFLIAQQGLNKEHSLKVIDHVATEFLSENDIKAAMISTENTIIRSLLTVVAAEKYFQSGKIDEAKNLLVGFSDSTEEQTLLQRVNRLRARIERGNSVKIGVLLPLLKNTTLGDSRDKKIAAEVLEGIDLALADYEEHSEPGQVTIEMDVRDSERKKNTIDSTIILWNNDNALIGVIGPVFSDETIIAATAAQQSAIPIVSPTATEEGISGVGNFVFQANSSISMRGKIMAQYAVNVLGAKNIAIVASNFPSAKTQADSFAAEVKRLGANLVIDRRYQRGETDLRSYMREIRKYAATLKPEYIVTFKGKMNVPEVTRRLVSYGLRTQTIDSILARDGSLNLTKLFFDKAKNVADSLKFPVQVVLPFADSLQYPVSSLDVIFCPISKSQQIGVITSQIAYYNLKATILGTAEWNNIAELELNKRYADGVIFGSDRWVEQNAITARVYSQYFQKYGRQISDNVLFGYDAMSMIIEQIKNGSITREQLANALSQVVNYRGVRNAITFSSSHVNGNLHILQYKDGSISKLQTYTYH